MRVRLLTLLLCLFVALPLAAQKSTGTIQGTVTDQSGAVVPGAKITALNNVNGVSREAIAGGQGEFVIPELDPATYDLKVVAAGFRESLTKGVDVHVSSFAVVNPKLQLGAATEVVTVEANPVQVETSSGTVGNVVEGAQVRELPLNGRSFVQLTQLMPGVSAASNFDSKHKGLEAGVDFSVNGNNTTNNLFLVDGANNNDVGSNRTILIYPSVDAIAEFKILRNSYGPEYGQAAGGVISIVTRGGGNQFHGTAYYFGRNDALNATEFFAARNGKKDVLRRNDFGYNISGPIKKDKAFFFWNEEWNREKRGQTRFANVPTAAIRAGDFTNLRANGCDGASPTFPDGTATGQIPDSKGVLRGGVLNAANVSNAGSLIAQQFPLPNVANPSNCNNWANSLASTVNWRQENARVDFKLNHANTLLVRYTQDSWVNPAPNSLGLWGDDIYPSIESSWTQPSRNMAIKLSTQIGSTAVNDFQFSYGYNKITAVRGGSNPGLAGQITAAVPTYFPTSDKTGGAQAAPPVFWGGIQPYQSDTLWTLAPWHNNEALYSFRDDFSKVKGTHTLKVGFLAGINQKNELSGGTSESESPAFWGSSGPASNNFANLLLKGTQWGFGETQREPEAQVRWKDVELYFGDNWKVKRNLTVEYGIRYSLLYQPTDASGKIAAFYPGAYDPTRTDSCNGLLVVPGATYCQSAGFGPGTNAPNSALKKNNYKAFAPRFGIAWDPTGKGTTSIRAGVGEFFQRERLNGPLNRVVNPPFALSVGGFRTLDDPVQAGSLQASGAPSRGIDPSDDLPASWQYNFTAEHELFKDTKIEVAYVGGYGYNLVRFADINEVPTSSRVLFARQIDAAGNPINNNNVYRPYGNGNWGQITYEVWNGKSRYDSLQTLFRTKFRKVDWQMAYTFSKSLSNSDITNSGDISADSAISDLRNPNLDYGPTLINRPHVFTSNFVYNAPELKGSSPFVRGVFGGWEAGGILSYASGPNATIYSGAINGLTVDSVKLNGASGGFNGTGYNNNSRPNLVSGASCQSSGGPKEQIFNSAAFTLSGFQLGTPGSAGRGVCRGPGIAQTDGSLYKNFKINERFKAQFRLEFFNLFNKAQFRADKINNTLGNGNAGVCTGSGDPVGCGGANTVYWNAANGVQTSFGQSTLTRGGREIQYALKISF